MPAALTQANAPGDDGLLMAILEKLGRVARLTGIVGLAVGSLVISVCSRAPHEGRPPDGSTADAAVGVDAASDAGLVDGGDPGDGGGEHPDARLWDVLCE
jgi:hypothetical protein